MSSSSNSSSFSTLSSSITIFLKSIILFLIGSLSIELIKVSFGVLVELETLVVPFIILSIRVLSTSFAEFTPEYNKEVLIPSFLGTVIRDVLTTFSKYDIITLSLFTVLKITSE